MCSLPREVLKWLQSLDLTGQIKNPKWDLSNGFLIAEIFSCYYPQDIQMHSFYNRDSLELKKRNWYILKNFILKNQLEVNIEDVDGTIHCREAAAVNLLESLYEILTNRKIKKPLAERETDHTDYAYQMRLPMHQRSTASKTLKNNLKLTEIIADQNVIRSATVPGWYSDRTVMKAQKIVNDHMDHRRDERRIDPGRFGIKPTLGDRCVRKLYIPNKTQSIHLSTTTEIPSEQHSDEDTYSEHHLTREPSVHFKETEIQQTNNSRFYEQPIQMY